MKYAQVGLFVPKQSLILDPLKFWELTDEGWRFLVGEDGSILAYMPPQLTERLAAQRPTRPVQRMRKASRMRGFK